MNTDLIFELTDDQKSKWMASIQEYRAKYVKGPRDYVSDYLGNNQIDSARLKRDVSSFIK